MEQKANEKKEEKALIKQKRMAKKSKKNKHKTNTQQKIIKLKKPKHIFCLEMNKVGEYDLMDNKYYYSSSNKYPKILISSAKDLIIENYNECLKKEKEKKAQERALRQKKQAEKTEREKQLKEKALKLHKELFENQKKKEKELTEQKAKELCVCVTSDEINKCPKCGHVLSEKKETFLHKSSTIENQHMLDVKYHFCSICKKNYMSETYYSDCWPSVFGKILMDEMITISKKVNNSVNLSNRIVYIYSGEASPCKTHGTQELVNVSFAHLSSGEIMNVNAFRCAKCSKLWISSLAFAENVRNDFIPKFDYKMHQKNIKRADQSLLSIFGYNVQKDKLSLKERHTIMSFVIEHKVMEPYKIYTLLSSLIKDRKNNPKMEDAISKWQEDIEFLHLEYNIT